MLKSLRERTQSWKSRQSKWQQPIPESGPWEDIELNNMQQQSTHQNPSSHHSEPRRTVPTPSWIPLTGASPSALQATGRKSTFGMKIGQFARNRANAAKQYQQPLDRPPESSTSRDKGKSVVRAPQRRSYALGSDILDRPDTPKLHIKTSQFQNTGEVQRPVAPADLLFPQGETRYEAIRIPQRQPKSNWRPLSDISSLRLSNGSSRATRPPSVYYSTLGRATTTSTSTNSSPLYRRTPKIRSWKPFRSEKSKARKRQEELEYWNKNTTPTDETYGMIFIKLQDQLINNLTVLQQLEDGQLTFEAATSRAGISVSSMRDIKYHMNELEEDYLYWARYSIYNEHFLKYKEHLPSDTQQEKALVKLRDVKSRVADKMAGNGTTHFDFRRARR